MRRLVKPEPGPVVADCTRFAPTKRSLAVVVDVVPELLVAVLPWAATETSNGLAVSSPEYSAMRMSGYLAAELKVTVTVFEPAAIFLA